MRSALANPGAREASIFLHEASVGIPSRRARARTRQLSRQPSLAALSFPLLVTLLPLPTRPQHFDGNVMWRRRAAAPDGAASDRAMWAGIMQQLKDGSNRKSRETLLDALMEASGVVLPNSALSSEVRKAGAGTKDRGGPRNGPGVRVGLRWM
jgi:hypothetical protein